MLKESNYLPTMLNLIDSSQCYLILLVEPFFIGRNVSKIQCKFNIEGGTYG